MSNTLTNAANLCIARMSELGYKGKKRDEACLEYFVGVACGLNLAQHPDAPALQSACALIVAVRGYIGVVGLSSQNS